MTLLVAAGWLVAAIVVGVLLRLSFGWLIRHANGTSVTWDDVGWRLLRNLSLPSSVIGGGWAAAEALRLREPVAGIVDRVLLSAVVLAAALVIARLAGDIVRSVTIARSGVAQSATIFVNLTKILVLAIGVLVVMQSLGISITPLVTALGVGGIGIALALQDTLSNLFAGIQVLASKKVQPGDFIRLDSGEDGYIVDITWRNTTIRALAGNIVIVPNARLASAILTNFHQPAHAMEVWFQAGVSYASDLAQVERVTVEVARDVMTTVPGGVPDFQPVVRFHTFGESSIDFTVVLQTTEFLSQYLVVHEFVKRLHARYRAEGIEIPFPIRTLVLPDGLGRQLVPAARRADPDQQ
ncbi:MAG: mechanosensitive ion channel [Micromonosporaceae bacterium]|nr:mechanosensitive ion channel [Micromonosporaceae bacterium]